MFSKKEKLINALSCRVIDNFEKHKEDYYEQDGELDGHRIDKVFYRVDSECLKPLIDELINNPNCGYITYMNNVIKEGFVPKKISCLSKQLRWDMNYIIEGLSDELIVNEVLASQMLNYFGCPTVFNTATIIKDVEGKTEYVLISADFMSESDNFKTLWDCYCGIYDLEETIQRLKKGIPTKSKIIKNEIIEEFLYTYFVRRYVLHDGDFNADNIGFLINKENKKIQLLNFDYEFAFDNDFLAGKVNLVRELKDNLSYLVKKYPRIYEKFIKKCEEVYGGLKKISKRDIKVINKYHGSVVSRLKSNLSTVCNTNQSIINSNLK